MQPRIWPSETLKRFLAFLGLVASLELFDKFQGIIFLPCMCFRSIFTMSLAVFFFQSAGQLISKIAGPYFGEVMGATNRIRNKSCLIIWEAGPTPDLTFGGEMEYLLTCLLF